MTKSLQGHFLIASPNLRDPNFFHSVILLVQHDENGTLGLVLNSPLNVTVQSAWKELSESPCEIDGTLNRGGPCESVLMALHTDTEASDIQVLDGVHFSQAKEAIEHIVSHDDGHVRLFVGYAGWSSGQLETELANGSWLVTPAKVDQIFQSNQNLWESLTKELNHATLTQWLGPKIVPRDPTVN
ncbi:MAG TPA: YqgE/AlgH family protein [Tepidisphaeraceae bacterium]|nr:YqgE/AlgH family protein [Tepidisphaeraceae bacterium]